MKKISLYLLIFSLYSCSIPYVKDDVYEKQASLEKDEPLHKKNSLEWWYNTGHLQDTVTKKWYGLEYVFFHFTPTKSNDYLMVNFAISDPGKDTFYYDYQIIKQKDYLTATSTINLNTNTYSFKGINGNYHLNGADKNNTIFLNLQTKPLLPVLMHNNNTGYEDYKGVASAGYYSYTNLETTGSIKIHDTTIPVKGSLWYDRQWNCGALIKQKVKWDWFAIQLPGTDIMLYQVHNKKTNTIKVGGTLYNHGKEPIKLINVQLKAIDTWVAPSKKTYTTTWSVTIPEHNIRLTVKADYPEQFLQLKFPPFGLKMNYWEGMCNVTGNINNSPVKGKAYLEMTEK